MSATVVSAIGDNTFIAIIRANDVIFDVLALILAIMECILSFFSDKTFLSRVPPLTALHPAVFA